MAQQSFLFHHVVEKGTDLFPDHDRPSVKMRLLYLSFLIIAVVYAFVPANAEGVKLFRRSGENKKYRNLLRDTREKVQAQNEDAKQLANASVLALDCKNSNDGPTSLIGTVAHALLQPAHAKAMKDMARTCVEYEEERRNVKYGNPPTPVSGKDLFLNARRKGRKHDE